MLSAGLQIREARGPRTDCGEHASAGRHLPQEKEACSSEENIRQPNGEKCWQFVLSAERDASIRKNVVEDDEQQCEDETGALAAAARDYAERHTDKHENQTSDRVREAAVQFEQIALVVGGLNTIQQRTHRQRIDGCIHASEMHITLRIERERHVGGGKGGDVVLIWPTRNGFVSSAVTQAHEEYL